MKTAKLQALITSILIITFSAFVILSWWLLFRDERALAGIASFYPFLTTFLTTTRVSLLRLGLNILPTIGFALVAAVALGAYLVSLKLPFSLKKSVIFAIVFQLIVFCSYPILSTDIFSYVFTDRVSTVYHQNTWKVAPNTYASDPFEKLADWKDQTKVYGLVEQVSYVPALYLGGNDLFSVILLYKVTAALFYLVTLWLFVKLTAEFTKQDERALAVRSVFWNPLFVVEMISSAHNDIIMLCFLVLALIFWKRKQWLLTGLVLALSVQVKLVTGIFFGFSLLYLLSQKQWKAALSYAASFAVVNGVAFALMSISPLDFLQRVLYNNAVYWQSLPALLSHYWSSDKVFFSVLLLGVLGILAIIQFWQKRNPLFMTAVALLIYLLFFAGAYWNWYVVWVLIWVPFIKQQWLKTTILILSATSLLAYPLLWISQRYSYGNPVWPFVYYLLILGVPALSAMLLKTKKLHFSLMK